jgi:excisionase family DNA binding protein
MDAGSGEIHLERLLTISEVANVLGKKPSFVYEQRLALGLPFIRLGRELRMQPSALQAWLAEQSVVV